MWEINRRYRYVVCDEIHYLLEDSAFNPQIIWLVRFLKRYFQLLDLYLSDIRRTKRMDYLGKVWYQCPVFRLVYNKRLFFVFDGAKAIYNDNYWRLYNTPFLHDSGTFSSRKSNLLLRTGTNIRDN